MLDTFRKSQRWLTGIFIFVIGGVFVFFLGLGGGGSPLGSQPAGQAVIEVGDIVVSRADFLRERTAQENRFRESLGDQFDSQGAASFIDSQTMRQLVDSAVLAHAAMDLGLTVTRGEIQEYLRGAERFRGEDGRFAMEAFENWVEWEYGSQAAFMNLIRQDLLRAKLRRLLYSQVVVTEAEARGVAMTRLEGVVIGYVSLDTTTPPSPNLMTDGFVGGYLAKNEAEARALYEQRFEIYLKPEARKAQHILFKIDREAGDSELAAVRKRAEDAMQQVVDGAAFGDVAGELSEDEGSRGKGGDIGYVVRGQALPELEEVVYAMEPGEETKLIQTDAGFHVVRVSERREATNVPFEEVSMEIARELASSSMAKELAESQADELAGAIRSGQSLEDAAQAMGLKYERSPVLRRRPDGYLPEIGTSTDLMATAFSLSQEKPSSPRVFALDAKRVLIQLIDRQSPNPDLLEGTIVSERERLITQKRNATLQTWLDQHRTRLNANNELLVDSSVVGGSRGS